MSTSEHLIVVCYLPLNRIGSEFNLYETISVPYRISDSQHYIKTQPSSDFFAVTNDADSYLLLNRYDLEFNCVSYKQKTICDSHIVLRKLASNHAHMLLLQKIQVQLTSYAKGR